MAHSPSAAAAPPVFADELAALRRALSLSAGTSSLSVAICNDRALRDSLIARLTAEAPGLLTLEWKPNAGDAYDLVRYPRPGPPPSAIFITGMENGIPFDEERPRLLQSLNASRELWASLHTPVVFWLAEYAATRLTTAAPDFWRYLSHHFEFIPAPKPPDLSQPAEFPGFDHIAALPLEEKRFRLLELESRLHDLGPEPPPDLLPHAFIWANELAELYQHESRWDDAEHLLRQILHWQTTTHGEDSPETATALSNLASLLQATNRLAEAEPLMRRALAIGEASFGKDHPDVAIRLNNLARLLQATNRLAEAEPLMRRALAIFESSFGKDHPNVASSLNNLASLLKATNRLAEAEPLLRRALAIDEASFGKDHPNVATCLNNLATLLQDTNRLAEAEPLMRRALAIWERGLGDSHPNVASALNNLALLLKATNRLAEAEPLMRRALAIDEASCGKDHPKVAIRLNNLAQLLQDTNRLAEAEPLMRRHLEIFINFTVHTGHPHPHLNGAIANYGSLLMKMGDTEAVVREKIGKMVEPIAEMRRS